MVVAVEFVVLVALELVVVVLLLVDVVVSMIVVVDVVVPGTLSGPYLRIKPRSPTIHPSSDATMNTERRATDIEDGIGSVPTTSHDRPSQ